jgi:rare lipoprotein A
VKLIELKQAYCFFRYLVIILFSLFLAACANKSRYSMEHDIGPKGSFDASNVPNAIPVWEPISRQGNKSPYIVRGIKYHIADISEGFEEFGNSSWYGLKFHGELTSNGEVYNMYAMSAAHKNLPLPSYVKVTNLDNDKQIIVRVNDRGPFHEGRVIDLSYAAATKLGFVKKGTARVKLELIRPEHDRVIVGADGVQTEDKVSHFIQVAAFSSEDSAKKLYAQLQSFSNIQEVFIGSDSVGGDVVHRVRLGPFLNENEAQSSLNILKNKGFSGVQIIQRALSAKNI